MNNSVLSLSNYCTQALDQATYMKAQGSSYFSGAAEWPEVQDCGSAGQLPGVKQSIFEKEKGYLIGMLRSGVLLLITDTFN